MSEVRRVRAETGAGSVEVGAWLNSAVAQVYAWMAAGLLVTGGVAAITARSDRLSDLIWSHAYVVWGLLILQLLLVGGLSWRVTSMSTGTATAVFVVYAGLNGLTLSSLFLYYAGSSLATAFVVTGGTFGVTSIVGFTTKRDLSRIGGLAFMALIGLIVATIVNIFLRNSALYWITSYAGVLIFIGLTASDTQKIKRMLQNTAAGDAGSLVVAGALSLYLDFLNLFLFLLRILGQGRD